MNRLPQQKAAAQGRAARAVVSLLVSPSVNRKRWAPVEWSAAQFKEKLATPLRLPLTGAQFDVLSKPEQTEAKDRAGAWLGAELLDPSGPRTAANVKSRTVGAIDADTVDDVAAVLSRLRLLGVAAIVHSTTKHRAAAPRLRIVVTLAEPLAPADYGRAMRAIAAALDLDADPASFKVEQCMFFPSVPSDGEFLFETIEGAPLDMQMVEEFESRTPARSGTGGAVHAGRDLASLRAKVIEGRVGETHDALAGMAVALRRLGRERDEIEDALVAAVDDSKMDARRAAEKRSEIPRLADWAVQTIAPEFEPVDDDPGLVAPSGGSGASNPPTVPAQGAQGPSGGALPLRYSDVCMADYVVRQKWQGIRSVDLVLHEWDGRRWAPDRLGSLRLNLATEAAKKFAEVAERDVTLGQNARRVAAQLERYGAVRGVAELVAHDPRIACPRENLDAHPHLLNTPAGVVDIPAGVVSPHDPALMLSKLTAVAPDFGAARPVFDRFLAEVFVDEAGAPDPELAAYVQAALGVAVTGDTSVHVMHFLHGHGRNGKSVLMDLVLELLGDYGRKIASTSLMHDPKGQRHPTAVAELEGVRCAVASEIEDGAWWDEAGIKEQTGDAVLVGRRMRQDPKPFRRTHKLFVMANSRPRLRSADTAIRARIRLVPFRASFLGREDPTLPVMLRAEGPAVLAWLVEGARKFYAAGKLPPCAAVEAATADYFGAQATVERFLDERCIEDAEARTPARALYSDYREWKLERGESPRSETAFGEDVARRFRKTKSHGTMTYVGLRLRPISAPPSAPAAAEDFA
jgi:P4 family phage/plasmid primase-like protien